MKLGLIGTGVMGSTVIRRLLEVGYEVAVYNRIEAKADPLVTGGAVWADTPKIVAEQNNILFTMVGYPKDVEEIYYEESGIFSAGVSGCILVDLTTSTPILTEKVAETAKGKGADASNAPVSGGNSGAKNGALTIMVGGEESIHNQVLPLFKEFGTTFTLRGSTGEGQHTKMTNQIMVADTMIGMTKIFVYTQKNSLALEEAIEALSGGSAANWSLSNYSLHILKEDHTPGSSVKHFIKNSKIASEEAEKMNLVSPATTQALEPYEGLADKGFENDETQALIKLWWPEEKMPGKKS